MTAIPAANGVLREARPADAEAIAQVHLRSTLDAYAPLAKQWPEADAVASRAEWLQRLESGDRARVDLVVELESNVVAFVAAGAARRKELGAEVEIYVIHVLPGHRGQGFGGQLWSAASQRVRGERLRAMYVATLAELRCCSFYEARGGTVLSRTPRLFHGSERTAVVYFWPAGTPSEVTA